MAYTGLDPKEWGPHVWAAIHLICLGAPASLGEVEAAPFRGFFQHLGGVLPCQTCRAHYEEHMRKHAADLEQALRAGGPALFRWSVDLHNEVNKANGKPAFTYEQAYSAWKGGRRPDVPITEARSSGKPGTAALPWGALAVLAVLATLAGVLYVRVLHPRTRTTR